MVQTVLSRLKAARVENGFTQSQLAKIIGMATPTYSVKERGIRPFSINEVYRIISALHLDEARISEIFFAKQDNRNRK